MWRDNTYRAALVAAPFFWLGLALTGIPLADAAWPLAAPLAFLAAVLVFPVLEEAAFRGLVQGELVRLLPRGSAPVSLPNLITSALFAGLHVLLRPNPWSALVFIPSLVFGHFRERHGTLGSPIILHVWYNLGTVWLFHPAFLQPPA
ncbi:MAG: JDVT-CTERM system glutamic-type intramembrane protease [Deltaproteobacteria bacterium]|nr:JDVT-CTERM system glutamic-type intramembrane protease [Deltaproteobacteria bacterium]